MMEKESIELKDIISKLSDEELLTMVNVKALDYRKEALEYAVAELADRGITIAEDASIITGSKTNLPMSFDNVHYYYNKSSTNSWIVPKCFTGDLIITKGVLYYFPHTAGQYKPESSVNHGLLLAS